MARSSFVFASVATAETAASALKCAQHLLGIHCCDSDPAVGHGTHVADIIAGKSADGTHKGVAPGAKVYAVKVCSAVSSSCNGIALLKGMDFSLDPNGDGDISDAVDIVHLFVRERAEQRILRIEEVV